LDIPLRKRLKAVLHHALLRRERTHVINIPCQTAPLARLLMQKMYKLGSIHSALVLNKTHKIRPMTNKLTHLDDQGRAVMVDVSDKPNSDRTALAAGSVFMAPETLRLIRDGALKKGDVLTVARIAGIMAAKRTSDLIPMCHPIPLTKISVDLTLDEDQNAVHIQAVARTTGKTGVEMEALTAVSVAALTIYDMAKAVDRAIRIADIRLLAKTGGVHGDYRAPEE
jgi:cyclic pyranopterin phosphate synthase